MKFYLNFVLIAIYLIKLSDTRRTLREYFIREDFSLNNSLLIKDSLSIYDQNDEELLCRLETFANGFIRLTNLYSYPSKYLLASIQENLWSTFCSFFFSFLFEFIFELIFVQIIQYP